MMRRATLLIVLWMLPASVLAANLARFFAEVHTLSGQFTQVVRDRHGEMVTRGAGRVWLKRPGRFRWDYQSPYKEQIVGRGSSVWLYDPGLAQATEYSLSHALGRTPALLLAGRGHLSRLFKVHNLPMRAGLEWIELMPYGHGQGFRWIRIGYRGPRIARIILRDPMGQTTDIRLHDLRLNRPLPASTFRFRPPPHTTIVHE
ncbi:MAG TPA: outer membrane lipoprotein chaperone LolA [Acidiferrobacter sp.]|nr:outer membrane lipoprotein chaperone LolA [Acidiferrobacter sp.]